MDRKDKIYNIASDISTQIVRTIQYCGNGYIYMEPEEFYAVFNRIMNFAFRKENDIREEEVLKVLRPEMYHFPNELVSKKLADRISEDYDVTREIIERAIYLTHLMKEGIYQKQGDKMIEVAAELENMICK